MVPVYKQNFAQMYEEKIKDPENLRLLQRMNALEVRLPGP